MESTLPVTAANKVTVLILDNLHKVSVSMLFKDVFPVIENRGPSTTVRLQTDKGQLDYYMHPGCYILGTMDRTRLAIQYALLYVTASIKQVVIYHSLG